MRDARALAVYYLRNGLPHHAVEACDEGLGERRGDPVLALWRGVALALDGSPSEAVREIDRLRPHREIGLAVGQALVRAHERCDPVDHSAMASVRASLPELEARAASEDLVEAGTLLWVCGDLDGARRLAGRAGEGATHPAAAVLRGWLALAAGRPKARSTESPLALFEGALADGGGPERQLDALLGKAAAYARQRAFEEALDALNEVIVVHEWFSPALAEKARLLVVSGDWAQARDVLDRALAARPDDVSALFLLLVTTLARDGDVRASQGTLRRLRDAISRREPRNATLLRRAAAAVARFAGRESPLIRDTRDMADGAAAMARGDAAAAAEAATQRLMMGDARGALDGFSAAAAADESHIPALHGTILAQIELGQLEDAEQQVEFLQVVQESLGASPELSYMQALLALRRRGNGAEHVRLLEEARRLLLQRVSAAERAGATPYSMEWTIAFDPEFQLQLARELLSHAEGSPAASADSVLGASALGGGEAGGDDELGDVGASITPALSRALAVLERLVDRVPGMLAAQLTLARGRLAAQDTAAAQRALWRVLRMDPASAQAHLLLAEIALSRGDQAEASRQLEEAVSHDFEIRNSASYHLLYARAKGAKGELNRAIATLEAARKLPSVQQAAAASGGGASLAERASIALDLADLYARAGKRSQATQVVREASEAFSGTSEEVRVMVANAELAARAGDADSALALLSSVQRDSPAFLRAQLVKARIYLRHKRDKRKYVRCFEALCEATDGSGAEGGGEGGESSPQSLVLLADAYMSIQAPDKAIDTYRRAQRAAEEAQGAGPLVARIALKIGKALVATHDFAGAIRFYGAALDEAPQRWDLRLALARLYLNLDRPDEAAATLEEDLRRVATRADDDGRAAATSRAEGTVRVKLMLADVLVATKEADRAAEVLQEAKVAVDRLLQSRGDGGGAGASAPRLHRLAAEVCVRLAQAQQEDAERAKTLFTEALEHDEENAAALFALAVHARHEGDGEECVSRCRALLRLQPAHAEANLVLADAMFATDQHTAATTHFRGLVEADARNFHMLYRLVHLLHRSGALRDVPKYMRAAEAASARAAHQPGYQCCQALHQRHRGDTHAAIRLFNQARRDGEWGPIAIANMVELYLSPDGEPLWRRDPQGSGADAVTTANRLLQEPAMQHAPQQARTLQAYVQIASHQRAQLETATKSLLAVLKTDRDHVPSLVALCTAFMVQGQQPKARNQLKRLAKMPFAHEHAADFEAAWLMLAELYAGSGKYDLAQELCNRALRHNRASFRAWEWLGHIHENERAYADAARCYEEAWQIRSEAAPAVGYKLAFNYLKAERWVEAIDVCHKVLSKFPNYDLRKDILHKARAQLRK